MTTNGFINGLHLKNIFRILMMSETTQIHPDKIRAYMATDYLSSDN
jgi:hypothetical protein